MPKPSKRTFLAEGRQTPAADTSAVPRREVFRGLAVLGLGLAAAPTQAREPAAPSIEREEFRVPTGEDGIELYVRNKRPAGQSRFAADRILLYVHGATYPASTAFDLPLAGLSMMDYLAGLGFDVYLVDLPGYGFSSRPKQMDQAAADNPPFMRTADAAKAVGVAVDFILKRRGVDKLDLMGWSWGTSTMGLYTTTHNDKVNRLVLYAPQWIAKAPPNLGTSGPLGAYRTVTRDSARDRWLKGVPEDKRGDLIPAGWFEQWADATWATDAVGAALSPPV
ncbi:alpha/beta hydrolase, partial [Methylobacterium sp. WL122]